jgi:3-deoxy-7-phosphoheptulonate synthase
MPWIGERTRALEGAHIDFFRGVANPIAVKIGPSTTREEVIGLCRALNPLNERGKLILVTRLGMSNVAARLPPLVDAVRQQNCRVLWVCDPMHGNAITTRLGTKTRDFDHILFEVEQCLQIHQEMGSYLGGVHFELTGEDVTECIGGGLTETDLTRNYGTLCDPRLNYRQAIEMAFCLTRSLNAVGRPPSASPPEG